MKAAQIDDRLPEGTVTFLFTDIEGSTELLKQLGEGYVTLLSEQRDILRDIFSRWNGREVDTRGDAFFYSFPRATQAVSAAANAQGALTSHAWPEGVEVRVRMGLHTGEPLTWDEGYVGMDVHRAARIAHVGHGGQVLLSATTAPLVRGELPEGVALLTLGRHRLKDMKYPERITQLVINDLPSEFPPLTSLEALPSDDPLSLKSAHLPAFLEEAEAEPQPPVFVARERELEMLNSYLQNAAEGMGGVVFVTGGPGRGKTALLEEFGRQAIDRHPDLLVVGGECSAYRGIGDPYLPFRRMMAMLTGDVEAEWTSGAINREDALRLWNTMPSTARMIVEYGPDLINVFVSGRDMMSRVNAAVDVRSDWQERLGKLVERDRAGAPDIEQRNLFEQVEHTLRSIAADHPLLIILDDMQWADGASLNLLFHLGRRLEGERILIVGAYRPEEVALGRGDSPHPLEKILAEFKRHFGEIEVDLGKTATDESRHFVDAFIDSERNRLSTEFRAALFAHTEGHPLFTVELLRNLQERGNIAQDTDGEWVETGELDWSVLPARVEGVIEERIGRLEDELKETLTVASVEGVDFTAQIVARVREVKERALVRQLSQELDKKHRLVQEHGILEILKHRLYQYRFRHQLFQQHIYNGLGDFERTELHREVGSILEDVYGDRAREIAPQLAYHFTEAGESERALEYLIQAGDQARMIYANSEARDFYQQAVSVLERLSDNDHLARTLMKLGLVYTANYQPDEARRAYDRAFSLWERRSESSTLDETPLPINILRMAVNEPLTLDPGIMSADSSTFIANQIYEGLTTIDHEFNVLPAAASSWDVLDEGRRYIFHLREGLYWNDGSNLSAADFEFAWKRNLYPGTLSQTSQLLYVIENAGKYGEGEIIEPSLVGVSALDDLTLEVRLESPIAYLPYLFSLPIAAPLHKSSIKSQKQPDDDTTGIVSNGPYNLSDYQQGERLILQRNPYYRGRFPGNVTRIECPFITDYAEALDAYENGELDALDMIASDLGTVSHARNRFPEELSFIPQLNTFYIAFRVDRHPFDDVRVRRAFSRAIDKKALVYEASQDAYYPATGGFIPPGMPGHSDEIGIPYNPDQARKLLEEAGYPEGRGFPDVRWSFEKGPVDNPVVPFLHQSWKRVLNLDINPTPMSWEDYLEQRETDPPDLALSAWSADYPDPDNFLRILFHSKEGINPIRWRNAEFDRCVEEAVRILEQNQRLDLYRKADHILVAEETGIVPIYYSQGRILAKPWVSVPRIPPAMLKLKEVVVNKPIGNTE
jgi:ABC-type oligopeptide transport system substrate-binding subunit/class 3 adenylate cyclase